MIKYRPLEENLIRLEEQAKNKDVRGFGRISVDYEHNMTKLGNLYWIPEVRRCVLGYYQTRYEQLKLMLGD